MVQKYAQYDYIDPRGNIIHIGDVVAITPYGSGNPTNGSFRFGVVEKFKPPRDHWHAHDKQVFVRCLTFNTHDQTFGSANGSWICQHNQRVFKMTGKSINILSEMTTQVVEMMKGRSDG